MISASTLKAPHQLLCEQRNNPLGIGVANPVFSWKCRGSAGAYSSAFEILVASHKQKLKADNGDLWSSGKIDNERAVETAYAGQSLTSRQEAFWKVRVFDAEGRASAWSSVATFEMGLLQREDWGAQWIGSKVLGGARSYAPAPFLRQSFEVTDRVRKARLYVTALGLYECEINGKRVGNDVFAPGWTDYAKRVYYQVFDVTEMLWKGENVLGAILGDGWYCGHTEWRNRQAYGDRPKLLARLELEFVDGSLQTIVSDGNWKTAIGPILSNDFMMGESYDARLELGDWSLPGYADGEWETVLVFEEAEISLDAVVGPPVREQELLKPIAPPKVKGNAWANTTRVYDLGQNIVGRVRIAVRGDGGTTVRLRFAEMLKDDGGIYTDNLRSARSIDYYTLKGVGEEVWEPQFTFHGFRYIEVETSSNSISVESISGVVLHSEIPETGKFSCSNPLLNQLQKNIVWGQKGNFLDIPTDCPQRDERLGWTGDAQVFIRTACFNRDVRTFFQKWVQDIRDAQGDDGHVPCVVPKTSFPPHDGGPAWSDAAVICPWTIYLCYGDQRILSDHFESMERYITHLVEEKSLNLIRAHPEVDEWGGFGDWLALDGSGQTEGMTPKDLIGTAMLAYSVSIVADAAAVLGRNKAETHYRKLYARVVKAFRHRFVTPGGLVSGATQTSYVLALNFDLLPEDVRTSAAKELVRAIQKKGTHLSTGFVGTPYLCAVLERFGHLDVAYELLEQETFPSWLFPVKNGATTIWERWDGWTPEKGFQSAGMNSFNHYAYGAIGQWMYATVAGLELDQSHAGYQQICFRPRPGGSLTWAKVELETPLGEAAIHWKLKDELLDIELTVPVNAEATLDLPCGYVINKPRQKQATTTLSLGSGRHRIQAKRV